MFQTMDITAEYFKNVIENYTYTYKLLTFVLVGNTFTWKIDVKQNLF
jgi:hypothetical protein